MLLHVRLVEYSEPSIKYCQSTLTFQNTEKMYSWYGSTDVGLVSRARSDAVLSQIRERLVLTSHSTAEARFDVGGVVLGEHLAGP